MWSVIYVCTDMGECHVQYMYIVTFVNTMCHLCLYWTWPALVGIESVTVGSLSFTETSFIYFQTWHLCYFFINISLLFLFSYTFLFLSHKLKSLDGLGIFLNLNLNTSLLTPTDIWQELKGERESVGMVCVCMFVYIFMYMCVCIHVDGYMCIYTGLCICLSACVCLSVSIYVHLFMYMYMCVHVYICM